MSATTPLRGLYAITSAALCMDRGRLLEAVDAALRGGAALIQYRDKLSDADTQRANAAALLALCRRYGAQFIVNDDVALAEAIGADGVHLGSRDGSLIAARTRLDNGAILGASCGPSLAKAQDALAAGASYVAFGRFFDSQTKPDAPQATVELLVEARSALAAATTICAIGGVTPANGAQLVVGGADLIAAVEGVFGYANLLDIEAAARAYAHLFRR